MGHAPSFEARFEFLTVSTRSQNIYVRSYNAKSATWHAYSSGSLILIQVFVRACVCVCVCVSKLAVAQFYFGVCVAVSSPAVAHMVNPMRALLLPGYGLPRRRVMTDGRFGAGLGSQGLSFSSDFVMG